MGRSSGVSVIVGLESEVEVVAAGEGLEEERVLVVGLEEE